MGALDSTNALVSIVVPVYNGVECLQETLDTILSQTYGNLEVICVNDGSTDGTAQILARAAASDDRVSVITQENSGQGAARNAGLDAATGDYVMMLDADDLYDSALVARLLKRALDTSADIAICASVDFDHASGKVSRPPWSVRIEQVPSRDPFCATDLGVYAFSAFMGWPWDKLYRREFIEEHELRFPPLARCEDLCFVFYAFALAERVAYVDAELIKHRMGRSSSVSNRNNESALAFYEAICVLKAQLKGLPWYGQLEQALLSWAFDYTLWNIDTMEQGSLRDAVIKQLATNGFKELEMKRGLYYLCAAYPENAQRYESLVVNGLTQRSLAQRLVDAARGGGVKNIARKFAQRAVGESKQLRYDERPGMRGTALRK